MSQKFPALPLRRRQETLIEFSTLIQSGVDALRWLIHTIHGNVKLSVIYLRNKFNVSIGCNERILVDFRYHIYGKSFTFDMPMTPHNHDDYKQLLFCQTVNKKNGAKLWLCIGRGNCVVFVADLVRRIIISQQDKLSRSIVGMPRPRVVVGLPP